MPEVRGVPPDPSGHVRGGLRSRAHSIDDDIEVGWLLVGLRRWWWLALVGIAAGAVVSFAIASRDPVQFEASTFLVLPGAGDRNADASVVTADAVRALVTDPSVVSDAMRASQVTPSGGPAASGERVAVDEIRNTSLVRLRVRHEDALAAAQLVKHVSARATALTRQLGRATSASTADTLKAQVDAAAERLRAAEGQLFDFQRRSGIGALSGETRRLVGVPHSATQRVSQVPGQTRLETLRDIRQTEMELAGLETNLHVLRGVYMQLARRYERARLDASAGGSRVRLLSDDVSPGLRVPRQLFRKTLLGAVAGLLLGFALIAGLQVFRAKPLDPADELALPSTAP